MWTASLSTDQSISLLMPRKETLLAHLNDFLPQMDEALSRKGTPVHHRPLEAATFFVDYLVLEIKGDTKENYLYKPWFASIFRPIQDWYKRRYGVAHIHPNPVLAGAVKHHGAFFLVSIPLMVARPQEDDSFWLTFAKDVLSGEDPASWISNGPSLSEMRPKDLARLQKEAATMAMRLRDISNNLLTAELHIDSARTMVNSVTRHLDKAAVDMCTQGPEAASLSIWELHMACEKIMKAYLSQEGISYEKKHDLRELNNVAPRTHDWSVVKAALGYFPSETRVMQWRYQEIDAPTVNDLWRFYDAALKVCSIYAARMSRTFTFDNFSVHLRRPPWLGSD